MGGSQFQVAVRVTDSPQVVGGFAFDLVYNDYNVAALAGVAAAATGGVVALGGAAWYARRRWLR